MIGLRARGAQHWMIICRLRSAANNSHYHIISAEPQMLFVPYSPSQVSLKLMSLKILLLFVFMSLSEALWYIFEQLKRPPLLHDVLIGSQERA